VWACDECRRLLAQIGKAVQEYEKAKKLYQRALTVGAQPTIDAASHDVQHARSACKEMQANIAAHRECTHRQEILTK
jgi:hypothetical protein